MYTLRCILIWELLNAAKVCHCCHRNYLELLPRSLIIVVQVHWSDLPAGVCLAVEPLTCSSQALISNLLPGSVWRLCHCRTNAMVTMADSITEVQWKIGCAQIMAVIM